jgi:hypothetical protein
VREIQIKIYLPELVYRLCLWPVLHYRKMRYGYAFRRIPLTQGKFAIVDVEDYKELVKYKWHAVRGGRSFYVERRGKSQDGRGSNCNVKMHRQLLNTSAGLFVDHINHNGLDNRRANLRIVEWQENCWNRRKRNTRCSSQYKGVMWNKRWRKWEVRIGFNGKNIFIGYFDDEKEAAMAYDAKAKELFGEFAAPNFPDKI